MSQQTSTTEDETPIQPTTNSPTALPKPFWVGLAFALAAFVVHLSSTRTSGVNGVVVECSYMDYFALLAAVAVAVCAVAVAKAAFARHNPWSKIARPTRGLLFGASAVLLVFAVVHVLRGLGMLGGPC